MEKNNFEFAKCFGCRKCVNEAKLNYTIKYDDGKKYWVCGLVFFITIKNISKEIVEEAIEMMEVQHNVCNKNSI
jgi:Zn-finger protein